jgi:hypothetical protein
MAFDNTNRGTLGKNNRKTTETQPEYAGSLNVNGVDYWLNGWVKEGENGKFFSLTVRAKEEAPRQSSEPTRKPRADILDSDIPF